MAAAGAPNGQPAGSASDHPPVGQRPSLLAWLWPVPVGLVFGTSVLAPIARTPGDPSGHVIGAGLGGVLGLVSAFVLRIARRAGPGAATDRGPR